MPETGAGIGTPAAIEGKRGSAGRRHRGRAVALENLGNRPDGVRELFFLRDHGLMSSLRQIAVADFAVANEEAVAGLSHRERREVVVMHVPELRFAYHAFD